MSDAIITAWAEPSSGPGWANTPVVVLYRATTGKLETRWLQPNEQTAEIRLLYGLSAQINGLMVEQVRNVYSDGGD